MLNLRTWDNPDYFSNGKIIKTQEKNPFKEDTLEFHLIEFILSQEGNYVSSYSMEHSLMNYIIEKNINENINEYSIKDLFGKAIWLAKFFNCIEIEKENIGNMNFGIFLESGAYDIYEEKDFINELKRTSPTEEGKNHLIKIAKLMSNWRKKHKIPTIIKKEKKYIMENVDDWIYERMTGINLKGLNHTYIDHICANTRGLFHHTGDELAFMMAALEFGNCYILGLNEFGGTMILSRIAKYGENVDSLFRVGESVDAINFDYIYGVPYSPVIAPSKRNESINKSIKNDECKINTVENNKLSEEYWRNEIFKKYALRNIREFTYKELINYVKNKVEIIVKDDLAYILELIENKMDVDINVRDDAHKQLDKLSKKYDNKIEDEISFFIKAIEFKSGCNLVNPKKVVENGFFAKDGNINSIKYFNLKNIVNQFACNWDESIENALMDAIYEERGGTVFDSINQMLICWKESDKPCFIMSDIVEMDNEYRVFVINGKPVAATPCFRNTTPFNTWENGVFDPRLCHGHSAKELVYNAETRKRVAKYAKFARKITKEILINNPMHKNYVIDLAYCSEKDAVIPIEVNSITWSGAYQVNFKRICCAIAGLKFNHEKKYFNPYLNYKNALNSINIDSEFEKVKISEQDFLCEIELKKNS